MVPMNAPVLHIPSSALCRLLRGGLRLGFVALVWLFIYTPAQAGFIDHLADLSDIGPAKVPNRGHSHILVIPLELDAGRLPPLDLPRIRRFFTDDPENRRVSFPGYWRVASAGRYRVSATVTDAVRITGCPFSGGQDCTPARGDLRALVAGVPLLRRVILQAIEENGLDLRDFDRNGPATGPDGWIDGVILIVNGGWFGVALPFGLLHPEWTIERDGVRIPKVAIASGPRALPMSLHEFGHLLGFADLYDEWKRSFGLSFSLMGGWRYDDTTPLPDAFSRMRIGWAQVEQVEGLRRVKIDPAAMGGKIYKLGDGREFFLVEARAPLGVYDRVTPQPALAVYQVNLDRAPGSGPNAYLRTVTDCPNCRRFRPFLMNVQADGRFDLQWKTRRGEPADLFGLGDALLPGPRRLRLSPSNTWLASNTYAGVPTGVSITEIDPVSQAPAVLATLNGPRSPRACARIRCPAGSLCMEGRCVSARSPDYPQGPGTLPLPAFAADPPPTLAPDPAPPAPPPVTPPEPDADAVDWRPLSVLLLLLWFLVLRPRLKRRARRDSEPSDSV